MTEEERIEKIIFSIDDNIEIIYRHIDFLLPKLDKKKPKEYYLFQTLSFLRNAMGKLQDMLIREIEEDY